MVGWFPPSLAAPSSTPTPPAAPGPPASSLISPPLKGSLQHTGHGDTHPDRSWGTPERLDESVKF